MKKKIIAIFCMAIMTCLLVAGCSSAEKPAENPKEVSETENVSEPEEPSKAEEQPEDSEPAVTLEDGVYNAEFNTDSSMFHVNEACDGKGTLTVKDGTMVIHVSLVSKNIENLYLGLAEDADKDGAEIIQPTTDTVTYSDGMTEEVYGFDIPVSKLDEEFDLAILGKKGTWYDHRVSVSNPEKAE